MEHAEDSIKKKLVLQMPAGIPENEYQMGNKTKKIYKKTAIFKL